MNNIYIYGGVGRGKTMIVKAFYDMLPPFKLFIHYQDFMLNLHKALHKVKGASTYDILVGVAKDMAKKYRYICIDEFEVKDIADAMIIARFFTSMMDFGVNFCITSNTPPENLYKDGLQRQQFLPFIEEIQNRFIKFRLDTEHDYRLDKIESINNRVMYPIDSSIGKRIANIKDSLSGGGSYYPHVLQIFKRDVVFPLAYKSILVTDFNSLCKAPLSSSDFIAICKHFTVIVLENVEVIGEDETDVAIRFINLIDSVYFHKVLLFITLATAPEQIYPRGKREKEFQRTISRLYEINSDEYLKASKHH